MSVSVFDAVYKQIIRYVQVVFLCTMLVFLYSAIRSVFAVVFMRSFQYFFEMRKNQSFYILRCLTFV